MKTKLLIFGITGDLSKGKLLPAVSDLVTSGQDIEIFGASRRQVSKAELYEGRSYRDILEPLTTMITMDMESIGDFESLKDQLSLRSDEQLIVYLSVPPASSVKIASFVAKAGMNGPNVKILFEKPFGLDFDSAKQMVDETLKHFKESQIYRIDHYMAKELANEIIRLRSDANNHHHKWCRDNVKSVSVIASEVASAADRAVSYEQTGALRDFLQCHNIQIASLVLMGIPSDFSYSKLSQYRLKAISSLLPADPQLASRAQYKSYKDDVGNPNSMTETFASVTLRSGDDNWAGVDIKLINGKKLDVKKSLIVIDYLDGTTDIFDEEILAQGKSLHSAYERVLQDAIDSNKAIFTSSDEVLASWKVLQPVLDDWSKQTEIVVYEDGSSVDDVLKLV